MELLKIVRGVRINSSKENFLDLYGFMLLSGSIESDNHNGTIENLEKLADKYLQRNFLHLNGFMLLSGSVESNNHKGAIQNFEKRSDSYKEIFCT